ncbi:MAG: hypothetical protein QOC96_1536 [Acidobacteriota bacterium]|nr:hypothetical protein [Acidobacteriota bacterium]
MRRLFITFLFTLSLAGLAFPALAQENKVNIDKSRIPAVAGDVKDFVPPGWKIEEQVTGDLNGDAAPDYALKLVEDKPAKESDDSATERQRALVIVLRNKDGKLSRAAVTDRLLQCTRCGGAFYGVVEAPANVKIEKGVIVVEQDHGSREMGDETFRFRYEPQTQKFALIGFDYAYHDRLTAGVMAESNNYLTGVRETFRGKGKKDTKSRSNISRQKIYLEDVDSEKFEEDASKRLGV